VKVGLAAQALPMRFSPMAVTRVATCRRLPAERIRSGWPII
jgi:hypothetical protein